MGTHRTKVTIPEDRMEAFFDKYGEIHEVKALISKSGIATGDMEVQVTVNREKFRDMPNNMVCCDKRMLVVI